MFYNVGNTTPLDKSESDGLDDCLGRCASRDDCSYVNYSAVVVDTNQYVCELYPDPSTLNPPTTYTLQKSGDFNAAVKVVN